MALPLMSDAGVERQEREEEWRPGGQESRGQGRTVEIREHEVKFRRERTFSEPYTPSSWDRALPWQQAHCSFVIY